MYIVEFSYIVMFMARGRKSDACPFFKGSRMDAIMIIDIIFSAAVDWNSAKAMKRNVKTALKYTRKMFTYLQAYIGYSRVFYQFLFLISIACRPIIGL